jgi:hypothetical protein
MEEFVTTRERISGQSRSKKKEEDVEWTLARYEIGYGYPSNEEYQSCSWSRLRRPTPRLRLLWSHGQLVVLFPHPSKASENYTPSLPVFYTMLLPSQQVKLYSPSIGKSVVPKIDEPANF